MNMKDVLQLLSIIITLPLMGVFIVILTIMMLFSFMVVGPFIFLTKLGIFYDKKDPINKKIN